jgi:parallel beta-helix repeat protein
MKKRILVLTIFLLIFIPLTAFSTDVSGDVWGEWNSAGNPYNVVGDLRVPPGSTLVIRPGCYIEFQGQYHLLADTSATFQADGAETDSITFTAAQTNQGWGGIRFLSTDSSSFIKYSIIEYGGVGSAIGQGEIYCHNSHLKVENCLLRSSIASSGQTIYLDRYNTFEIRDNLFSDNSPTAISVYYHSEGIIEENIITGYHNGFVLEIAGNSVIRRNVIFNNQNCCVILADAYGPLLIEENIIYENDGLVMWFFHNGGESIISRNLIFNNYYDAPVGPGIIGCDDSAVRLINNTISNNTGHNQAYLGGFYEEFSGQYAILKNNIIWGNNYQPDRIFDIDNNVGFSLSYSDVQGGWGGSMDVDPLFVDPANGNFHLMSTTCEDPFDSPCVDAGDPNILDSLLDCSWGLGGLRSDMGAYGGGDSLMTSVFENHILNPDRFTLHQNYPNPFNAQTNISFSVPDRSDVKVEIFDTLGRKVRSLLDGQLQAGEYTINWNGKSDSGGRISSGVYFYNLKTDRFEDSKKMVILK